MRRSQVPVGKHPWALAWDEWLESNEGRHCADTGLLNLPDLQRQYLQNRLWLAFMAGAKAADKASKKVEGGN